ncbi:FtsQ-type POTRA domain-containing protein [Planococcus sp. N028]|uniref:Cell division protein DivIB n=1 Tax=Planococcus shixiaomingii TaxID=3058393 RepID=A0ABT8N0D0_9BACL|nr:MULTISPECIES: FtsQ-type POTRA domain-containing protein [unclassified Planococcus (in: firmicutes)]MDN7241338.1 FtsQ-type POTRA domain-containing protein [Planococcus sp. N028]WKA53592.1 FtsQ-type POTRA domain-containing protein [Planococcus sp. N022]
MDKVIDIEERIPTLRERRKKRTNRKFVALLVIFLVFLAILYYSQSKHSEIQTITVSGNAVYEKDNYLEASGLAVGQSMWSFKEAAIEKRLNNLEWVENATVEKKWLTGVDINIDEFEKSGYLERENSYQIILSNGYAVEKPVTAIDGPIFTNFEDEKKRVKLVSQLAEVEAEVSNLISQVILASEKTETSYVTLYMNDGNEVHAILSTLAEKLNYYPSVTAQLKESQKGVIDMEVGIFFTSYDDVYGPPKEEVEDEEITAE